MAATAGFRTFVAEHEGPLLRTAYLLTGDLRTAEELLAAALARTHRRWRWGAAADPVAAVRRAMVRNRPRTRHRTEDAVRGGADAPPLPAEVEALRRALVDLPPRTRAALVLRLHEGLTEAQAADVLGCPPDLVATLTAEGTAVLRARGPVGQPTSASPPGPSPAGPTSGGPAATAPPEPDETDDDAIYRRPR
ncbi:sigma factor-like helix-turn-helix DNA-binding protein [Modestobacter sp. URMC 112]